MKNRKSPRFNIKPGSLVCLHPNVNKIFDCEYDWDFINTIFLYIKKYRHDAFEEERYGTYIATVIPLYEPTLSKEKYTKIDVFYVHLVPFLKRKDYEK